MHWTPTGSVTMDDDDDDEYSRLLSLNEDTTIPIEMPTIEKHNR